MQNNKTPVKLTFSNRLSLGWRGIMFILLVYLCVNYLGEAIDYILSPFQPFGSPTSSISNPFLRIPLLIIAGLLVWILAVTIPPFLMSYAMQPFFPLETLIEKDAQSANEVASREPICSREEYNPRREFHRLWSSVVDTPNYDKSAWQNVDKQLISANIFNA